MRHRYISPFCIPTSYLFSQCTCSPCLNDGICFSIDEANTPRCACTSNWRGPICAEQSVSKPLDTHCKCTPSVTNAVSFYVPEYRIV